MKSQGLPINFIVLAAVGIFVLILAVIFVISGGSSATAALSPQQVRNSCNTACVGLVQWAAGRATSLGNGHAFAASQYGTDASKTYCTGYTITGSSTPQKCPDIGVSCSVTFSDGTGCKVKCDPSAGYAGYPGCEA